MRNAMLCLLLAGLLAVPALGQCPGGQCPLSPPQYDGWGPAREVTREKTVTKNRPTPAWRYEKAVGYRQAVVRVISYDGGGNRSIGSGVLVRWAKRIVVLTARHVVKDAKRTIIETHKKKVHKVKVLKVDATWDCAVLGFEEPFDEVQPAEVEMGAAAMFRGGERLESAGYGPDGQLAVNSGLFQGYRRTVYTPNGPDDWMVISGHARGGDSGGPIFNAAGKVVGVLWGTDGEEVVGVQAGRLHVLLDAAVPQTETQLVEQKALIQRKPTPPKSAPPPQGKVADGKALIPWRGEAEKSQNAQDQRIDRLIGAMENQQRQPPTVDVQVQPQPPAPPKGDNLNATAVVWIVVLCSLLGVGIAVFIRYGVVEKE